MCRHCDCLVNNLSEICLDCTNSVTECKYCKIKTHCYDNVCNLCKTIKCEICTDPRTLSEYVICAEKNYCLKCYALNQHCVTFHDQCENKIPCCFCKDLRPRSQNGLYEGYIDTVGLVYDRKRHDFYCPTCKKNCVELFNDN